MTDPLPLPDGYATWLAELKDRIRAARQRAALAVNTELVLLYWHIGNEILSRQDTHGWGAKVIDQVAHDLRATFPDMRGLSPRNLKYMRAFAQAWPDPAIVQGPLAQLPWYHQIALLEKLDDADQRLAYAAAAVEYGWSRNTLVHHINLEALERSGLAITNFDRTLPPEASDLAHEVLKDPYRFEFLGMGDDARERDIERALVDHVTQFLVELGVGFAYVGRQVLLEVGGEDFYLDLLFYHLGLRCYVVVELKAGKLRPEHLGQLNFYLVAVDEEMRHPHDAPTIGLLLCQTRDEVVAEYALRGSHPLGVASYRLGQALPSVEQLQRELSKLPTDGAGSAP